MASKTIIVNQSFVAVAALTRNNQPAPVHVGPTWSTTDGEVTNLQPSGDLLSCTIKGMKPGEATVTCYAEGDGVLQQTIRVTVESNEANRMRLTLGAAF